MDEANAYAEGSVFRSQAGAGSAVDDPGGGVDDPIGGDTNDLDTFGDLANSTTTSSKTSARRLSPLLSRLEILFCPFRTSRLWMWWEI